MGRGHFGIVVSFSVIARLSHACAVRGRSFLRGNHVPSDGRRRTETRSVVLQNLVCHYLPGNVRPCKAVNSLHNRNRFFGNEEQKQILRRLEDHPVKGSISLLRPEGLSWGVYSLELSFWSCLLCYNLQSLSSLTFRCSIHSLIQ